MKMERREIDTPTTSYESLEQQREEEKMKFEKLIMHVWKRLLDRFFVCFGIEYVNEVALFDL